MSLPTGQITTSYVTATATAATLTLPAPGPGKVNVIHWIGLYLTQSVVPTAVDVKVTYSDGSTMLAHFGGIAAIPGDGILTFPGGLRGAVNDTAKVILTTTGGTVTVCRVTAGHTVEAN